MPSRISGACNGCRTKKQKCSGDRNGCTQCSAAGQVCTWPEQRKRGPAKGYIEGLEHRLHEAETLLLQLLPVVTSDQLATAASNLGTIGADGNESPEHAGARSSPPVLNKKTGIEYWESFPLDSAENIRRWQQDCALHSQFRDHDLTNGPGSSRGASRPSSVDLTRENPSILTHRKSTSMSQVSHSQYRSMSTDSYQPGHNHTEYMPTPTTAAQQNWNSTQAYIQPWQQGINMHHQQHQQQPQPQRQMVAAGGAMDVDGGHNFFTNDVKRNLFW